MTLECIQSRVNDVHIAIVVDDDDYYSLGEDFCPG
jgi:hypothetical protein